MAALTVVEDFDVFKDCGPDLGACFEVLTLDRLFSETQIWQCHGQDSETGGLLGECG